MIRTETEYQEALTRLAAEKKRMSEHKKRLKDKGLDASQIETALEPMESFHLQLVEEADAYEKLKQGDLGELSNLHGLGRLLIALRIARGLSQTDLAGKLSVDVSQVCRDEKNEYHGITVERANRILDALHANLVTRTESPIFPEKDFKEKKRTS